MIVELTQQQQAALDLTIGRITNDALEDAAKVWFKDEYEDDNGTTSGPVYVETSDGRMHPLNTGEAEWHSYETAKALAEALGLELVAS